MRSISESFSSSSSSSFSVEDVGLPGSKRAIVGRIAWNIRKTAEDDEKDWDRILERDDRPNLYSSILIRAPAIEEFSPSHPDRLHGVE